MSDIDHIPIDWQKLPLKRVADVTNSGCYGDDDESDERSEPLKAITTAHIDPLSGFKTENASVRYFSRREKAKYVGRPGDIFVVKSSGSNENVITGKRAQIRDEDDLVFTNFLLRVRANQRSNPRFLYHLLGSSLVHSRIKREVATTTYPNLNLRQYLGEPLPIPDLPIQRAIADFLDRETARIDLLIEKKQRLVALLGEKRSATITAAVTGQIGVERGSGVKTANLRWIARNMDYLRIPLNGTERSEMQGSIPYWGANGIVDYVNQSVLNERVILIGEDGAPFFDKNKDVAFISEGPAWINNHIHIIKPDRRVIDDRYLKYFLNQVDYSLYINGSTRDKLTQAQLGNIAISYFEMPVQCAIADFLDHEIARLQKIQETTQQSIDRLKEYRCALITAAVTGQIDVAKWGKSGANERQLNSLQAEMEH